MTGVDRRYLVANEAMALMSLMRKSSKYVQSGIATILGAEDEPLAQQMGLRNQASVKSPDTLLQGFAPLSRAYTENIELDADVILKPFLRVIQSPVTSGALTLRALVAVEKLLTHVLDTDSPNISQALYDVAVAVTRCRFEARDHAENDNVLHQIMSVETALVCGKLGYLMCDDGISEVVETCLSMACHMRRGELLLRSARLTLTKLVITVFGRADALEFRPAEPSAIDTTPLKLPADLKQATELESAPVSRSQTPISTNVGNTHKAASSEPDSPVAADLSPYTAQALRDVFKAMVSILEPQPTPPQYSDKIKSMVIQLLCHVFETTGPTLAQDPWFVDFIGTHLFKYITQFVRSNVPSLVADSLRLFALIHETDRKHYKLQVELILTYLLSSLTPLTDLPRDANIDGMFYDGVPSCPKCVNQNAAKAGEGKSPEIREIMIEAISRLVHSRGFFSYLFINYDCDIQQTDLCEDLIGFLCRNAYPDSATWSTASVPPMCLENVLCLLQSLYLSPTSNTDSNTDPLKSLLEAKSRKGLEVQVADLFNKNPKKGISLAIEKKVIPDNTPKSIAHYLQTSQRLDKAALGRYLAKEKATILDPFVEQFNFSNMRIDEALREFLCTFRLPGESAEIEPIFEKFSGQYLKGEGNSDVIADKDAAFILCYSVIMLNTDQHSPQVKRRMQFENFQRNLGRSNGDKEFPEEFLQEIFKAIKTREIVLPDEHDNEEGFEFAWRNMQLLLSHTSPVVETNDASVNLHIFKAVWRPVVSTLAFIFATATDDLVFSRVINGLQQTAALATRFNVVEAQDHILECLGKISALTSGDLSKPQQNIEIRITSEEDKNKTYSVIVSDLSVAFGGDLKSQMALITLFRIVKSATSLGSVGWSVLTRALTNLYLYDLVKLDHVPRVLPCYTFERSQSGKNVGIFSVLSSYLTSSADTPPEPSDEDVDAALGAQECIASCKLQQVFEVYKTIADESTVRAIESTVPETKDKKFYAADGFLLELLVLTSVKSDLKPDILSFVKELKPSDPQFEGLKTRILLRLGADIYDELSPEAAPYILDTLLSQDKPRTWTYLSKLDLQKLHKKLRAKVISFIERSKIEPESFDPALKVITTTIKEGGPCDKFYELETLVSDREQFLAYLRASIQPCVVSDHAVRELALDRLQRFVQSSDLGKFHVKWQELFTEGLIPLLETLLKPDIYKRDIKRMDLTRQRSASIVSKTFLSYAMQDDQHMEEVWIQVLHVMDRLLGSKKQHALQEGINEMLKNVILVLQMSSKGSEEFWEETEKALKDWMPELAELARTPSGEKPKDDSLLIDKSDANGEVAKVPENGSESAIDKEAA